MEISVFSNAESIFLLFYAVQRPSERFPHSLAMKSFEETCFAKSDSQRAVEGTEGVEGIEGGRNDRGP
jgi:hypothetical protein